MKCGARVAIGVVGGYFLGRTRKMKLALMLGGMAAGRRAGGPGTLVSKATRLLGESPQVARLGDELRGRLVEAGKAAAVAVAARQIESLAERLTQRVGSLTDLAASTAEESRHATQSPADGESSDSEESSMATDSDDSIQPNGSEPDGRRSAVAETPEEEEEPSAEGSSDEEDDAEEPPPRRSPARTRASSSATQKRSTRAAGKTARVGAGRAGGSRARANRSSDDG